MKSIRNLSLLAAAVVLSAGSAYAASTVHVSGWVSDSMCGAKHAGSGAACVKKCIANGAAPVLVDSKHEVWKIDNPDSVRGHYGDHVAVTAKLDMGSHSVHILAVE